ncbi:MAG: hypothetical protein Q9213_003809 [Squamulea squamosa]
MPKRISRRSSVGSSIAAIPSQSQPTASEKHRRQITVYDAVAGRISTHGFIPVVPQASKNRDTISTHHTPIPPEEVLFRRRHAPERYEEDDVYFAHEDLKDGQELPDSDLLKAIHTYAADFYGKALGREGDVDFKSMDETALMCVGVLLEEYMHNILGDTGDMVFVEAGEEIEVDCRTTAAEEAGGRKLSVKGNDRGSEDIEEVDEQEGQVGEDFSASSTREEDYDEESTSNEDLSQSESTESGRARKRAKISSDDDDSSD